MEEDVEIGSGCDNEARRGAASGEREAGKAIHPRRGELTHETGTHGSPT